MDDQKETKDDKPETGNTNLLIGGGVAAYGTTLATTVGFVCPVCIIAAPAFLGWGAVQKYKHLKNKGKPSSGSSPDNPEEV